MEIIKLADYNIYIGFIKPALRYFVEEGAFSSIFVIVDENTKEHCLPVLQTYLPDTALNILQIPAGEQHKHIQTCQSLWQQLMDYKADRRCLVINLGGGVIGDMGGFVAGTFKRGVQFVQVPTTLLAQVDASIGGKLGIDFAGVKNSVGLFRNPEAVFIDPVFLKTLPTREVRSGFAELVKHSLIGSPEQWSQIRTITQLDADHWPSLITPSLLIKKEIVESDPFERGRRKALNFGHTIGHAVESFYLNSEQPLLHGEAVAIGMICEAFLSQENLGLNQQELEVIKQFITNTYDQVQIDPAIFPTLVEYMLNDKKNENGIINFTLINAIGKFEINQQASREQIIQSFLFYAQ